MIYLYVILAIILYFLLGIGFYKVENSATHGHSYELLNIMAWPLGLIFWAFVKV